MGHPGEARRAIRGHSHLFGAVSLEPSPILRALPKSTSPARKDRKVGLDKLCLLMEVRYPHRGLEVGTEAILCLAAASYQARIWMPPAPR